MTDSAPLVRLQKMYVKDLSFESPGAPRTFMTAEQPDVEMRLSMDRRHFDPDLWEVSLNVTVTAKAGEETYFIVEVEHAGLFQVRNVPGEHIERLLFVDGASLLLPFTRQIIHQATSDGGFPPLLVEPIDFRALYEQGRGRPAE